MKTNNIIQENSPMKLSRSDIIEILSLKTDRERSEIFAAARAMRERFFGNKVFLYGFVYFSTYCKNNCTFCYYRKDNSRLPRYRKSLTEIVSTAVKLADSGVHLIDLTMGEDAYYDTKMLSEIISAVKNATDLPIMLSPGVLDNQSIDSIKTAGADWYALYQESFSTSIYNRLRVEQPFETRINAKKYAFQNGLNIEEGLLTGAWDSPETFADSILAMGQTNARQLRVMTFIPQKGTPFENIKRTSFDNELMVTAILRLLYPDRLIPASLDVDGLGGLAERLDAGANVVTSLIPPGSGFAGVASAENGIESGERTVSGIAKTLEKCGLTAAKKDEYKGWLYENSCDWRETSRARNIVSREKSGLLRTAC
jgi:methylornithine synthase